MLQNAYPNSILIFKYFFLKCPDCPIFSINIVWIWFKIKQICLILRKTFYKKSFFSVEFKFYFNQLSPSFAKFPKKSGCKNYDCQKSTFSWKNKKKKLMLKHLFFVIFKQDSFEHFTKKINHSSENYSHV